MFRIVFIALCGGEREIVVCAASMPDAVMAAVTLRNFGSVVTCTRLDAI